jgi:hypothetical protein
VMGLHFPTGPKDEGRIVSRQKLEPGATNPPTHQGEAVVVPWRTISVVSALGPWSFAEQQALRRCYDSAGPIRV